MKPRMPTYDLKAVKEAVARGDVTLTRRVRSYLMNHACGSPKETTLGVFDAMRAEHFYKTVELDALSGVMADIYRDVPYDGTEWYVKFFVRDGMATVDVWSLKEDGYGF
jgi:hypothetical protein